MKIMTIQPANTSSGEFDVMKPRPYPFHVNADSGEVLRQDFWQGDPQMILGFQKTVDVQTMDRMLPDLAKSDTDAHLAVGMFPICVDSKGGMYTYTMPIESVTITESPVEEPA